MTLHRMANVHNFLEMWQCSQNLHATQKESRAHNMQMTVIGYILDTEEIVRASWSLFQHDGVPAIKLSERSPLPPALSAKNLPGGGTQILCICQIRRIYHHPVEIDENSAPESILDTEHWLIWNNDFDNPNDSRNYCAADVKSEIEQDNDIENPECPEQWDVNAAQNFPQLFRPIWKSKGKAEMLWVTVNAIDTRRNTAVDTM